MQETVRGEMIAAPARASRQAQAPASAPTAAVAHSVAAVFSPVTDMPCFMMTPAPRKPMPVTIWAATRVGSVSRWKV
jgi:hypothetical protein